MIEGSKTPQNEKARPTVHKTASTILKIMTQIRISKIKMISRSCGFIKFEPFVDLMGLYKQKHTKVFHIFSQKSLNIQKSD